VAEDKGKQIRTPWMREGADEPPVARQRSAGAMTKGKLLTTPSRMLKLIVPLTTRDANTDRKDVEPLALLVHPNQPLSYLERLIQSELPLLKDENGKEKVPSVYFRAEDASQDSGEGEAASAGEEGEVEAKEEGEESKEDLSEGSDEMKVDGKRVKTGKLNKDGSREKKEESKEKAVTEQSGKSNEDGSSEKKEDPKKKAVTEQSKTTDPPNRVAGGPGDGRNVEAYSGLGHEAESTKEEDKSREFVRWSSSTEIGDFIRDAARGKEFAIEIEGAPREIRVGVPSFSDRTYYLRLRLRKKANEIASMADIKKECDDIAHRAAKRVATAGGVALVAWWGLVFELTFNTSLGWDVMEPVTYLVGLTTIIGGYGWFLVHNRQVSYRSAMNITISNRQSKLYDQKGFDVRKWEDLIEEGNIIRKEVKAIAQEYDVEWNEKEDEKSEKVTQALKEERERNKENKKGKKDDDDDE
jgi:hypothetical protein